jgi:hypothetical protein
MVRVELKVMIEESMTFKYLCKKVFLVFKI